MPKNLGTISDNKDIVTKELLDAKELIINKVTSISSISTNTQYPSAKAVYDNLPIEYTDQEIQALWNEVMS